MEQQLLKHEAYRLASQAFEETLLKCFDPRRAELFTATFGYALPDEYLEWLASCNGGYTVDLQVLYGLMNPEKCPEDLRHSDVVEDTAWFARMYSEDPLLLDVVGNRLAVVGADRCGDYYLLRCVPDAFGCRPVYFLDSLNKEWMWIMASDWWHFIVGFLSSVIYDAEEREAPFWWPFERERVLAFDPALRHYEGTGLLAWEYKLRHPE